MEVHEQASLAPLTTLRVGGPAARLVEARSAAEIVEAVAAADAGGQPVLLLGGGSNLLVGDSGWPGTVVLIRSRGVVLRQEGERQIATVQAGEPWDEFVAYTVARGLVGVDCMSGIPGLAGATPVQNVGAYGQDASETVTAVQVFDRELQQVRNLTAAECHFGYRSSIMKYTDRFVVLSVDFMLRPSTLSDPILFAELAAALDVPLGGMAPVSAVRDAVLSLRRRKGMVLDSSDPDTWSVGSFFLNPVLTPDELARFEGRLESGLIYPSWPMDAGVKLSAAWLIQQAGYGPGFRLGAAGLSSKHTLALTNRGGATASELVSLATTIRKGVAARFGVNLLPEARLVGLDLHDVESASADRLALDAQTT